MPLPQIVLIAALPVYIRPLPSGDAVVWHPYNDQLRSIIEPVCRHRGYWQPKYNNWVIRHNFVELVVATLKQIGDSHA